MILADIDKSTTCELIKQLLAVDFFILYKPNIAFVFKGAG